MPSSHLLDADDLTVVSLSDAGIARIAADDLYEEEIDLSRSDGLYAEVSSCGGSSCSGTPRI